MNLFRELSLTKTEFLIGVVSFLFIAGISFSSRHMRLSDDDAISTQKTVDLKLEQSTNLEMLITHLEELDVFFNKKELHWAAKLLGWRTFKRGNYQLNGQLTYQSFL